MTETADYVSRHFEYDERRRQVWTGYFENDKESMELVGGYCEIRTD